MAMEHRQPEEDVPSTPFDASLARARQDVEMGRVFDGVSSAALARFGELEAAEAQKLLDDPARMRRWLAAHK